MGRRIFKI
jgi:hypothetical protein